MNPMALLFGILVIVFWGTSAFFDKLTADKLGNPGIVLWFLGFTPGLLIYFLIFLSGRFGFDRQGLIFLMLASALSILALVFYYFLLLKSDLSSVLPLTALYPAFAVALALIFLHESLTVTKIIGLVLSVTAIFFLSL